MKNCLLLLLAVVIISCQGNKSTIAKDEQMLPDSLAGELAYGKEDFDRMITAFRTDPSFQVLLDTMLANGDSNAVEFRKLMDVPFERRFEDTKLTDRDIAIAIYSFKMMDDVKNKFSAIDSTLSRLSDPLDSTTIRE